MGATTAGTIDPELLFARVQELQELLDSREAGATRELADELVAAVVAMYGAGLERILGGLDAAGEDGVRLARELGEDPLVATLLLIHDLHPVALADRVQEALESVRPYMESHGGNVELLSLEDGVARLRLKGSCSDCAASAATLELAIKQALEERAPDLLGLEVEGVAPEITGAALPMAEPSGLELPMVMVPGSPAVGDRPGGEPQATSAPAWLELEEVADLAEGNLAPVSLAGQDLVVANIDGTLLAYRDRCAACGGALRDGALTGGALACPGCGRSFFLPAAGRSMDEERIQLAPVPLLREQGRVRVALGG
jgi:Fe-S cluster biogenesis protein NfuA/nitrite reductase/ring-hydroxylating ferredoxin subunit